jgi:hypothetical protein
VIERENNGYVSLCPELDIASQGDTIEEAHLFLVALSMRQTLAKLISTLDAASASYIGRESYAPSTVFRDVAFGLPQRQMEHRSQGQHGHVQRLKPLLRLDDPPLLVPTRRHLDRSAAGKLGDPSLYLIEEA